MQTHVVVLAGGRGERFWPLSRRSRPKQVLELLGRTSLLRATIDRALHGAPAARLWGIAPADLGAVLRPHAPEIGEGRWIWECEGRNTAPAVAAAVAAVLDAARRSGEPTCRTLILPADHWIPDAAAFWQSVSAGEAVVDSTGRLVTFGVPVTRVETGYGYIERGPALGASEHRAFEVKRFHEKPDSGQAQEYRQSGQFLWNAGIFLFDARRMREEILRCAPELSAPLLALEAALESCPPQSDPRRGGAWDAFFRSVPAIAIDRAVFERSGEVAVLEAGFEWDDLGSWVSWGNHVAGDDDGNRILGDAIPMDARDNVIYSEPGGLVAVLGVRDLVVVRTGDVTLVCPRDRVQEIRELVRRGRSSGSERFT